MITAEIKEVSVEALEVKDLQVGIVLNVPKDSYYAVYKTLEDAGFVLRNWIDKEIIIYAKKI